jgi:RimJ/RimL family protein N-acetyltransferase
MFRILNREDVSDRYVGWLNDPEVNKYLEVRFTPQTRSTCEEFVESMKIDPASYFFGIFDKANNSHIGNIKIGFIDVTHRSAELGLVIGEKEYWGKGYATEAIRSITQWGFNSIGLKRIEAGCYDSNMGSLRAFLKTGYAVEGFKRSCVESEGVRVGCFSLAIIHSDCLR